MRSRMCSIPRAGFLRHVFLRLMSRLVKLIGEKMLTLSCILTSTSELDFPLHRSFMLNTAKSPSSLNNILRDEIHTAHPSIGDINFRYVKSTYKLGIFSCFRHQ